MQIPTLVFLFLLLTHTRSSTCSQGIEMGVYLWGEEPLQGPPVRNVQPMEG